MSFIRVYNSSAMIFVCYVDYILSLFGVIAYVEYRLYGGMCADVLTRVALLLFYRFN